MSKKKLTQKDKNNGHVEKTEKPEAKAVDADQQLVDIEEKLKETQNDLLRAQADLANLKRRNSIEKQDMFQRGRQTVATSLLSTIDNLERALQAVPEELDGNDWVQGIASAHKQLLRDLSQVGLEKMTAQGEKFDPERHEAVAVDGDGQEEVVDEVLQSGFTFDGNVVRPAMVKVKRQN